MKPYVIPSLLYYTPSYPPYHFCSCKGRRYNTPMSKCTIVIISCLNYCTMLLCRSLQASSSSKFLTLLPLTISSKKANKTQLPYAAYPPHVTPRTVSHLASSLPALMRDHWLLNVQMCACCLDICGGEWIELEPKKKKSRGGAGVFWSIVKLIK